MVVWHSFFMEPVRTLKVSLIGFSATSLLSCFYYPSLSFSLNPSLFLPSSLKTVLIAVQSSSCLQCKRGFFKTSLRWVHTLKCNGSQQGNTLCKKKKKKNLLKIEPTIGCYNRSLLPSQVERLFSVESSVFKVR